MGLIKYERAEKALNKCITRFEVWQSKAKQNNNKTKCPVYMHIGHTYHKMYLSFIAFQIECKMDNSKCVQA